MMLFTLILIIMMTFLYCLKSFILSELESNPEMIEDQLVEKFVYLSKDERYLHFLDGI